MATIITGKNGLYLQERIGYKGLTFKILKIRTMNVTNDFNPVTLFKDKRVTPLGKWLRQLKLDELPQLYNVLIGDMSLVGPRPDVKGFADELDEEDSVILTVRPGITGPATIKFRHEDQLLAQQKDPILYNKNVIWKEKVEINKAYIKNWTFRGDLQYLYQTFFG